MFIAEIILRESIIFDLLTYTVVIKHLIALTSFCVCIWTYFVILLVKLKSNFCMDILLGN